MTSIALSELPQTALLRAVRESGAFTDGYVTEIAGTVLLPAFVEAFYTTALFKVERAIIRWFARRPSTDSEAKQLGEGSIDQFAAWRVEGRNAEQLLLADFTGRTKSWLMIEAVSGAGGEPRTRLYFGSAIVPRIEAGTGRRELGFLFHALLGFHKLYSRLLLSAARTRLAPDQNGSRVNGRVT